MIRRPTHLDHYLCRQIHNGIGVRAFAVTNLSGELCRTYCRVMDRIGGKIFYTENTSPNFVRCGPYQARCVDGNCVGFNYHPYGSLINNAIATSSPTNPSSSNDQTSNDIDSMVNFEDNHLQNGPDNDIEMETTQSLTKHKNDQQFGTIKSQQLMHQSTTSTTTENVLVETNRLLYY